MSLYHAKYNEFSDFATCLALTSVIFHLFVFRKKIGKKILGFEETTDSTVRDENIIEVSMQYPVPKLVLAGVDTGMLGMLKYPCTIPRVDSLPNTD